MNRKTVAAEQRQRIIGRRPDDREPLLASQRQNAIIFQHRDGIYCGFIRQFTGFGCLQRNGIFIGIRVLEQPQTEFLLQNASDDLVDFCHGDQTLFNGLRKMACAVIFRQLDIQTGVKSQRGGFRGVAADAMMLVQQTDAAIIRHYQTVKAPFFAQQRRHQEGIRVTGLIINIVIGRHD